MYEERLRRQRVRLVPYNRYSQSARSLSNHLGGLLLRTGGSSSFRHRETDLVINWGSSNLPPTLNPEWVLNPSIETVSNKRNFFSLWDNEDEDKPIPDYWTIAEEIPDEAFPIVCRQLLTGHSGAGISIANNRAELVDAPLFVKYVKKQDEYRVHLGYNRVTRGTSIISVQRKARRNGFENPNWQVRNHQNGFVYIRGDVNPPDCVVEAATAAFDVTGLDFGACDVIYNRHYDRAYCLEINTAPGLEGQTVFDYANFFRNKP